MTRPPADDSAIVIPLGKGRQARLLLVAGAFVAASVWLWSIADTRSDAALVKLVAVLGISFFGLGTLVAAIRLFDRRPGLVIDADGIFDNTTAIAIGRIGWQDITGIGVWETNGSPFIVVRVRNPDAYAARRGRIKRWLHAANGKLTGSPINLSATSLATSFDELERTLSDALRRHAPHAAGR